MSPACRLCEGYEEYYAVMYAKSATISATTCSSCGSSCEEYEIAENLFLNELDPRTRMPNAKSRVHVDQSREVHVQSHACEISSSTRVVCT